MQEKANKRPKRKYGVIKKNFVSVEAAEEEKKKNVCSVEEKLKKINMIKTLKVDTPWTTGSSDEGTTGYMYYRIQQAKKNATLNPKYNRILDFLDGENVCQLDFNGVIRDDKMNKDNTALFKKAQELSENQKLSSGPSLFMRRKLRMMKD